MQHFFYCSITLAAKPRQRQADSLDRDAIFRIKVTETEITPLFCTNILNSEGERATCEANKTYEAIRKIYQRKKKMLVKRCQLECMEGIDGTCAC